MLILEDYQERAVAEIVNVMEAGAHRAPGAAPVACMLHATTGAGKTLILTRAASRLIENGVSSAFLWTAPFGTITDQTESAVQGEGGGNIRARSLENRSWGGHRTGDVWVTTAALIANSKAGPAEDSDFHPSLKSMAEQIRKDGRRIFVIIDEAHLNARDGNKFVEACLAINPDGYVAATATPDDKVLGGFFRKVGVEEFRTISVDRQEVIARRLNKGRLDVVFSSVPGAGEQVRVDALISAAWAARNKVRAAIEEVGLRSEPLMLVQAENGNEAKLLRESVKRVTGLDDEAVAIYEAGSNNKVSLSAVAADERVKALVFKVAAGTGFDAPRACVLASARTVKNETSAAQFVGRIMRVPRDVRAFLFANPDHPLAGLLDTAHLFLLHDTEKQGGFSAVADKLRDALIAAGAGQVNIRLAGEEGDPAPVRDAHPIMRKLIDETWSWDDLDHLNEALDEIGLVAYWPRLEEAPTHFRREEWALTGEDDEVLRRVMTDAVNVTPAKVKAHLVSVCGQERAILVRDDVITEQFEDDQSDHRFNAYLTAGHDAHLSAKWTMERIPGASEPGARRRLLNAVTDKVIASGSVPGDDRALATRVSAGIIREFFGQMKTAAAAVAGQIRSVDAQPLPDLVIAHRHAARANRKSIYRHYTQGGGGVDDDQVAVLRIIQAQGIRIEGRNARAAFADESWATNDLELALIREFSSDENARIISWWARNPPRKPFSVGLVNAGGDGDMFYPDFVAEVNGRIRLFETKYDEADLREKSARGGTMNADYGEVIFLARGVGGEACAQTGDGRSDRRGDAGLQHVVNATIKTR